MYPVKISFKRIVLFICVLSMMVSGIKQYIFVKSSDQHTVKQSVEASGDFVKNVGTNNKETSNNTNLKNSFSAQLETREYFISQHPEKKCFQSPNRQQNLRSFFYSDKWTVTSRMVSSQNDELSFNLLGIYSDNQLQYRTSSNPGTEVKENNIRFHHDSLFSVEYANKSEGIEQTFIVNKQPQSGNKNIQVKLKVNNEWKLSKEDNNEIILTNNHSLQEIKYNKLKAWDANAKELNASINIENNQVISIDVDAINAVYPVTIDPTVTVGTQWNAESNQANCGFGCSIYSAGDVNGDGLSDIIVGANKYDNTFADEGAAFVYLGGHSGISTTASWTYYGGQAGAEFGTSVTTAADVNGDGYGDVIIGAPKYDNTVVGSNEGKVFAFYGGGGGICAGGSLSTVPNWTAQGDQVDALFGYAVGAAGDVDNDGYSDIVVGAPSYDNGETDEGVVFYYKGQGPKPCLGAGGGLQASYTNLLEVNQASANFGVSVSGAGDVNGDNFYDIVIGANLYDNGQTNEGKIFVWHGKSGVLNSAYNFTMEENVAGANYGISVSTAGDVNGDGYSDILAGANLYSNSANGDDCAGNPGPANSRPLTENGRVFLYPGASGGLYNPLPANKWFKEGKVDYSHFGSSVNCAGDMNGDGFSDVIIGSADYDEITAACAVTYSNSGRTYVYEGGDATFGLGNVTGRNLFTGSTSNMGVGYSVASAGDINGDGFSDVIMSSISFTNGQTNEGKIWAVYGAPYGLDAVNNDVDITFEKDQVSSWYGSSVSSAGDVNGDGFGDIIVGAQLYDNTLTNEGAAFVYLGTATGITSTPAWSVYSGQNTATLGFSLSCAGDVNGDGYSDVIVSAYQYDDGGLTDNGKVDIYFGSASGLSSTPNWTKSGTASNQHFGYSVACAGDVNLDGYSDVIIGSEQYSNGQTNEGAAFVFHGSATGPGVTANWTVESNQANANFGFSVACAGDVNGDGFNDVIVGAPNFTGSFTNEGRVHIYHGSPTGLAASASWTKDGANTGSNFGYSVASAGDVDANAFSDIVIGAPYYTNGQSAEGRAQVYYGSVAGTSAIAAWSNESNVANYNLGLSVSSAGDVNADGYSDIIYGTPFHTQGIKTGAGKAVLVYGGLSGLTIDNWICHGGASTTNDAMMGFSVASAGDVNGDGYSDVIIGSPKFSKPQNNEGIVRIYYGGEKQNTPNNIWLLNSNLLKTIDHSNVGDNLFGIAYNGRSFIGRSEGRIAWETKKEGVPFDSYGGLPISKRTSQTGRQTIFTVMPVTGYLYKQAVAKAQPSRTTKSRIRIQYPAVNAITGQIMGPWRYLPGYMQGGLGFWSLPLPVELLSFDAQLIKDEVQINWKVADENAATVYTAERSTDGVHFTSIATIKSKGNGALQQSYEIKDNNLSDAEKVYYRLNIGGNELRTIYSSIKSVPLKTNKLKVVQQTDGNIVIYAPEVYQYTIADINGRHLLKGRGEKGTTVVNAVKENLLPGTYLLSVHTITGKQITQKIIL